jgi:hypothetical protein
MNDDAPLFTPDGPRHSAGRVRRGLDADARAAIRDGGHVAAAPLAACRSLADQIDQLERQLRSPYAKPYDRVPLAGLVREFRESYDATFAATQRAADPLTHALAAFLAADRGPQAGDTPGPDVSE